MTATAEPPADAAVIARPTGRGLFETRLAMPGGDIVADEPVDVGGGGAGPTPYELLSAALAACTAMTMRLYAERRGWTLPPFSVTVAHRVVPGGPRRDLFDRRLVFEGPLEPERRVKMLEIADKCPVHRSLERGADIATDFAMPPAPDPAALASPAGHEQAMEEACAD
jgi:putative redox protein